MKNFALSTVAVLAMSTFAIAGGDIAPVEPAVEVEAPIDNSSFYVGLGYSYINMEKEWARLGTEAVTEDAVTLLAGYNFNKYVALEGRYTLGIGDLDSDMDGDIDGDLSNIGIYLKPMYPFGGMTVYGLLGYGQVTLEETPYSVDGSESGFQWGLGASVAVNDNVGIFVDYTRLYDDTGGFNSMFDGTPITIDGINVGFTYKF